MSRVGLGGIGLDGSKRSRSGGVDVELPEYSGWTTDCSRALIHQHTFTYINIELQSDPNTLATTA